jgi:hypothetical protein
VGFKGVTAIETKTGGFTVRFVPPLMAPSVAVIVVLPCATLDAEPELFMVAKPVKEEFHVTDPVRFCVLLSV